MDDKNAAEAFNTYFSSIFVHDDGNLPPFTMRDIKRKFKDDIDFSLVTVEKLLTNIKDILSCRPDGLSSFLPQKLKSNINLPLLMVFNQSY